MKNEMQLLHGDCLERLKELPDNSVDSVVTDPPYGLSFMGKKWDYDVPSEEVWRECLRVLKPGGHLLAFAGTRTQHRMAVRIEDAGFEIRDMIAWVYGSGFPKSLDVSKAIDKAAGAKREKVRVKPRPESSGTMSGKADTRPWIEKSRELGYHEVDGNTPATDAARQWSGWGTALKPALEPITVARKPLDGTVAENVLRHGTGGINVDGCRVGREAGDISGWSQSGSKASTNRAMSGANYNRPPRPDASGRFPANLIHDGSDEVVGLFPNNNPGCKPHVVTASDDTVKSNKEKGWGSVSVPKNKLAGFDDGENKSAARFFYCAKASKADRDEGCEGLELVTHQSGMAGAMPVDDDGNARDRFKAQSRNHHPTVKPTDLMRYLCRLVTPPNGVVLDPFMGSGSTGKAAMLEGFQFIGIEREAEYMEIAKSRIEAAKTLI